MAEQQNRETMRRACCVYFKNQADQLSSETAFRTRHVFSESFEKRMYDAMHSNSSYRTVSRRNLPRRGLVRYLAAAALSVCLLVSTASLVPALQMRHSSSAAMAIEAGGSEGQSQQLLLSRKKWDLLGAPQQIEDVYLPTYLPEGYEVEEGSYQRFTRIVKSSYLKTDAQGGGQTRIIYSQRPLVTNLSVGLGGSAGESAEYIPMGLEHGVFCRNPGGDWSFYWNDGYYLYNLSGNTEVSQSELTQMAESLKEASFLP